MAGLEKRVFLICPVRGVTQAEQIELADYVRTLEDNGCRVHYPPRDTNQDDPVGDRICRQNRAAILAADEVHVYWVNGETTRSTGSYFDFGMALMAEKPLYLANPDDVLLTSGRKGFNNVLRRLAKDSPYAIRR